MCSSNILLHTYDERKLQKGQVRWTVIAIVHRPLTYYSCHHPVCILLWPSVITHESRLRELVHSLFMPSCFPTRWKLHGYPFYSIFHRYFTLVHFLLLLQLSNLCFCLLLFGCLSMFLHFVSFLKDNNRNGNLFRVYATVRAAADKQREKWWWWW